MNWYGSARSNYFRVKDLTDFQKFCDENVPGAEIVHHDENESGTYKMVGVDDREMPPVEVHPLTALLFREEGGLPTQIEIDDTEYEFIDVISTHLVKGEVAIFMESGAEGMRYVSGHAIAVTWDGRTEYVSLNDIYDKAAAMLGIDARLVSGCEY
jgi:hypothetical protein